jgi:hypothetical protein
MSASREPQIPTPPNSGFSLDAAVHVGAHDRAGLERLLRYCARPPFALERLDAERVPIGYPNRSAMARRR